MKFARLPVGFGNTNLLREPNGELMSRPQAMQAARRSKPVAHRTNAPYRILVASAGDPSTAGAVRVALALARRRGATVQVLAVATPFPHNISAGFGAAPPAVLDDDARRATLEA